MKELIWNTLCSTQHCCTPQAGVAFLPFLFACQCHTQASSSHTGAQHSLGAIPVERLAHHLSHLCICSISCHPLRGSLSKSPSLYIEEL